MLVKRTERLDGSFAWKELFSGTVTRSAFLVLLPLPRFVKLFPGDKSPYLTRILLPPGEQRDLNAWLTSTLHTDAAILPLIASLKQ